MAKRSNKGIPDNLKPLAKQGARVRFNGFWLNASSRDRVIAEWLDETPGAAAIVKDLIYRYLTGAIPAPVSAHHPERTPALGEAGGILGDFDD